MDFQESQSPYGARYGDFHRASLQKCLLERVAELGGEIRCNSRVTDIVATDDGATATASLAGGEQVKADLLVGSDGVFSKLVEVLLGRPEPPLKTGDLAYRLLLSTEEMLKDPELAEYATDPQVNYWLGPDAHAGNNSFWLISLVECSLINFSKLCPAWRRAVQYGPLCS